MSKYLVITGGSRGIGLAAIERFKAEGYKVINLSRSAPAVDNIQHISVDLVDETSLVDACATIQTHIEGCEQVVVVHNSGLLMKDSVRDISSEALRRSLEVNVVASTVINRCLLPVMPKGSSIVYVGSTLGEKAVANSLSYVVAKHAQIGLMRSTCQDLVGSGISTSCVCPGFTDTEMLRDHLGNDPEILNSIASGVAAGRLIDPAEIAETVYFCANNLVINGSVIHANLGQIES